VTALVVLCDHLQTWLDSRQVGVAVEFGQSAMHERVGTTRKLVIAPGGSNEDFGKLTGPTRTGGSPMQLADLAELFRCYVSAYDPDPKYIEQSTTASRRAQYIATRAFFDIAFAALRQCYRDFQPGLVRWVWGSMLAPFGGAIMLVGSVCDQITDHVEEESINVAPKGATVTTTLKPPGGVNEAL
jgi:hypothetical protein